MDLLSKLSAPFENVSNRRDANRLIIFQLGEEKACLERKRKQLCEKLGENVYYRRQDDVDVLKEEIRRVEEELSECLKKMEMLSNEI